MRPLRSERRGSGGGGMTQPFKGPFSGKHVYIEEYTSYSKNVSKRWFFLFHIHFYTFFLRKRFLEPQEFKKQGFRERGDLLHPEN